MICGKGEEKIKKNGYRKPQHAKYSTLVSTHSRTRSSPGNIEAFYIEVKYSIEISAYMAYYSLQLKFFSFYLIV